MSRASLSARVVRPRVFARATPPRDFRTPTTRREALLFPPFAATLGLFLARPPLASPREDDVRRFGAPGARPASSRRVVERPSARWTESPAALPNAETLPWHFSVPSEGRTAHLHRVPLTRGEEEIHSLDVLFRTPEGDRVGVSVWPLPPETPAETLRLTQVRAAVEATPLAPGLPLMRDARTTLDVGALETADVKANARATPPPGSDSSSLGASDATGGIDRSRGASTFYFEYGAPPFVAVSAVPAEGALYACFAVAADEHAKSNAVRTLREVTESFRVGR